MAKPNNQQQPNDTASNLEAQLWAAADKMRGHMDASEYKGEKVESDLVQTERGPEALDLRILPKS